MPSNVTIAKLAAIIQKNPGATVILDNDCWWMNRAGENPYDWESDDPNEVSRYDRFEDKKQIVSSSDMKYSSGPYGRDILEALAYIVGIELEDC
jgi:hypothetical protein